MVVQVLQCVVVSLCVADVATSVLLCAVVCRSPLQCVGVCGGVRGALRLSVTEVAQQPMRCCANARCLKAVVVLSDDASSCSCIVVASLPSDAALASLWRRRAGARGCVSTLRLGCQATSCYGYAWVSLATFARCLQSMCCCCLQLFARAWHRDRCGRVVTCATLAVSLACCVGRRRQVPVGCLVVSYSMGVTLARCCT